MTSTPLDQLFHDYISAVLGLSAILVRGGAVHIATAFGLADLSARRLLLPRQTTDSPR
jgi:hypothetical protein